MHSKKGMALMVVVSLFMVLMIILASMSLVYQSNLRQTSQQEENMKAYYLALSGIELAYSALIQNTNTNPVANPIYYYTLAFPSSTTSPKVQEIELEGGSVTVTASRVSLDGEPWIQIRAEGQTDNAVSRASTMRFLMENPAVVSRENG